MRTAFVNNRLPWETEVSLPSAAIWVLPVICPSDVIGQWSFVVICHWGRNGFVNEI